MEDLEGNGSEQSMDIGGNIHDNNYFVTFTAHPDPDVLTLDHPWLFLAFYPADDNQRLGN